MAELQENFKKIMLTIEERIQDKETLNFVKEQIASISTLFLDQLDRVVELSTTRMDELVENQRILNEKIIKIEKSMGNIEKDIYLDDEYDFEIICPYCNYEFVSDFTKEVKEEIECPECHNIIDLDWNQEEVDKCQGHCSCCEEECGHEINEESDNNDNVENNNDDDM